MTGIDAAAAGAGAAALAAFWSGWEPSEAGAVGFTSALALMARAEVFALASCFGTG